MKIPLLSSGSRDQGKEDAIIQNGKISGKRSESNFLGRFHKYIFFLIDVTISKFPKQGKIARSLSIC